MMTAKSRKSPKPVSDLSFIVWSLVFLCIPVVAVVIFLQVSSRNQQSQREQYGNRLGNVALNHGMSYAQLRAALGDSGSAEPGSPKTRHVIEIGSGRVALVTGVSWLADLIEADFYTDTGNIEDNSPLVSIAISS